MNQREIKFRAWDKSNKRMLNVVEPNDQGKREYYPFEVQIGFSHWDKDDIILMQYTGLKDFYEKEIYEGDLVKWSGLFGEYDSGVGSSKGGYGAVTYKDGEWIDKHVHGELDAALTGMFKNSPKQRYAVLGNIYENPELLK